MLILFCYYYGRSPSFKIADTPHEKYGFWIFAFAQEPPKTLYWAPKNDLGSSYLESLESWSSSIEIESLIMNNV